MDSGRHEVQIKKMDGGHLGLTENEWEFIFKALDLARNVFTNNPVLQDVMNDEERYEYIGSLSNIMDKIGRDGKIAWSKTNDTIRIRNKI